MSRGAGRLGWFLVWAVVYCDIGTSVYYAPGLLWRATGDLAWIFVVATMLAFVLLCTKVVEIARRFSSGGGVVSLADSAFGPWWGCMGGQLIMVDYFLTVAISAASGVHYIDSVLHLGPWVLPVAVFGMLFLAGLNIVGIKESARVSSVLALAAFAVNLAVMGTALLHAPDGTLARIPSQLLELGRLSPWQGLAGYAGAWLAFSGLESLSQLSPAMRDLGSTPRRGMIAVAASVLVTAPMLTFLSTAALSPEVKDAHTEHFISELAGVWGGQGLRIATVLTASTLLMFAANTAIIGNYHVQLALTRRNFLPSGLAALSHRYQTPYRAILFSTLVPIFILLAVGGNMDLLGSLYAFGLLGCFVMNSVGIDVLRWRDGARGWRFWLGVATSMAILVAFGVNLVEKPLATAFGGGLTALGMLAAVGTRNGFWDRLVDAVPGLAPPRVVARSDAPVLSVEQAASLATSGAEGATDAAPAAPGILVATRGTAPDIFREAATRAAARGQRRVFVLYVDEIPGLFYPQLVEPTPEGVEVLTIAAGHVRAHGCDPVLVWGVSHSAAASVVDAAEELRCDTVVIGATQRNVVWHALRGQFIQDLLARLPGSVRLIVVG
jgi:amino acid transporter/nucleotide-binding universal stress UspA family protein